MLELLVLITDILVYYSSYFFTVINYIADKDGIH